jgi:hypothetical protein
MNLNLGARRECEVGILLWLLSGKSPSVELEHEHEPSALSSSSSSTS